MPEISELNVPELVSRAVEILSKEIKPRKVIPFGSAARGDARTDSDVDLLVVMDKIDSRFALMRRAAALLAPLNIPVDVLVYSVAEVEQWGSVVNHVINEALVEGRVVYDVA